MDFDDVMSRLEPIVGLSSLIGAPSSVRIGAVPGGAVTLGGAYEALAHAEHQQKGSTSDYAYWGWQGQVSFWRTVVSLLEAAEVTGRDHLPDVPFPDLDGKVVMDACSYMEEWGKEVKARSLAAPDPPEYPENPEHASRAMNPPTP
jgi:hypothetical protein